MTNNNIDQIINHTYELLSLSSPNVDELLSVSVQLKEMVDEPKNLKDREKLIEILQDVESRIQAMSQDNSSMALKIKDDTVADNDGRELEALMEEADKALSQGDYVYAVNLFEKALSINPDNEKARIGITKAKETMAGREDASAIMDKAESLFYSGKYSEAIHYYEQVLRLEPNWERARAHREEAAEYIKTGYIPTTALPPEVAMYYGRAQSAYRVGRYDDALKMLDVAIEGTKRAGFPRWSEGENFRSHLYEERLADETFREGLKLYRDGKIDDAIQAVENAATVTHFPKYEEKAMEMRENRRKLNWIRSLLQTNLSRVSLEDIKNAHSWLLEMMGQYPDLEWLHELQYRLSSQGDTAVRIAKELLKQADETYDKPLDRQLLTYQEIHEQLSIAKAVGFDVSSLEETLKDRINRVEKAQDVIERAIRLTESNKVGDLRQALRLLNQFPEYASDPRIRGIKTTVEAKIHERQGRWISFGFILFGLGSVMAALLSAFFGNAVGFIVAAFLATIGFIFLAAYLTLLR